MCRWIVYFSHYEPILLADLIIRPQHSLVKQVDEHYLPGLQLDAPTTASDHGSPNHFTNIDGFGVGWYSSIPSTYAILSTPEALVEHPDTLPTVYKCISPPRHDLNLKSLAHAIESRVIFGHIRATTTGALQLTNCHPFQFGRFLFQHNGGIGRFEDIQIDLMSLVSPRARSFVKGTTDTEWFAALFFHHLDSSSTATWLQDFSLSSQLSALRRTISTIISLVDQQGGYRSSRMGGFLDHFAANLAITDGTRLITLRFAYPPQREAPSLYWSTTAGSALDRRYEGYPDDGGLDVGDRKRERHKSHVVVASEPMSKGDDREWSMMEQGTMILVDPEENGGEPMFEEFELTSRGTRSENESLSSRPSNPSRQALNPIVFRATER